MSKTLKRIGTGLLVVLLSGLVPGADRTWPTAPVSAPAALRVPPEVTEAIEAAASSGEPFVEMDMLVPTAGDMKRVEAAVTEAGGEVLLQEQTYARVRVPAAAAESLPMSTPAVAVGVNEKLPLTQATNLLNTDVAADQAGALADVSMQAIGTNEFRREHNVSGQGIRVAVIDSGVDPGHPGLQRTPAGAPKIVDWKDFTGEGLVRTTQSVTWDSASVFKAAGEIEYRFPGGTPRSVSRQARFGYWEEAKVPGAINRDLNRNGTHFDKIGVLLVDSAQAGIYDLVYVDTNNNRDFGDERPLQVYRNNPQSVGALGQVRVGPLAEQRLFFVAADIDPAGRNVVFGFDGLGHGTQVAGVLGANDPRGFTGVAPGVEIMALKAVSSESVGEWYAIADAVQYAAENGAKVINISLAGLAAGARADRIAPERLNRIARQYGVLIVLAAGNTGPGLSSGATLGNPSELLSVGSYYSAAMWMRDFGYVVPSEGVYWRSGMGPRTDGSYVPGVIAPGGSPTTVPGWLTETGYTASNGTSIATPHAAGVAALLMEASRRSGNRFDWLSVKRALEMGARRIPNLAVFEQGHGVISLNDAMNYLKQVEFFPALSAQSRDGSSGLLARSYRPGSTEFTLTNLDPGLTRIGVVSSEPWVRTALATLTLPYNVPRQLPLRLNPPSTPGVHSAFLTVFHQGKFGQNIEIPITYVKPLELSLKTNAYSTSDRLEVGRFQRYFFEVKPGSASFDVTVRMLPGLANTAQGTAQVHVFRPDGQAAHQSPEIGANGQGLTTLFQADSPVPGVWEVVVYAIPDRQGAHLNAGYSLEATVTPGAIGNQPVQLYQAPGSTVTHQIRLSNPFRTFTGRVEGVGVTRTDTSQPWRVVSHKSLVEDFTINELAARMRVEISNPVAKGVALDYDLDLYLDRYDPASPGNIITIAQKRTVGSNREFIELKNLPPGRYFVSVMANGRLPDNLQYQYRRLVGAEGFNVMVEDTVRKHDMGDSWTAEVTIQAPSSVGRYTGYLFVRDTEKDETLTWIPFEVSVGQPGLAVEPFSSQLVQGRPGAVVLETRNPATGQPVEATLTINGQRFLSRNGRVSLPVLPTGDSYTMLVEAAAPGYQILNKEITVPVADKSTPHPVGGSPTQENGIWRRKIITQWP